VNVASRLMVAMVKSVIDGVEQAQLAELFIALESAVPSDTRFAESVTFWRYQLLIGVEPSQLAGLLVVLEEVAELSALGDELRRRAGHRRPILEPRVQLTEPWRMPSDGHTSVPGPRSSAEPDGRQGDRDP
jgi:hypothetical protein